MRVVGHREHCPTSLPSTTQTRPVPRVHTVSPHWHVTLLIVVPSLYKHVLHGAIIALETHSDRGALVCSQCPQRLWSNDDVKWNIPFMFVTFLTSHEDRSWLKALAL